MSAEKGVLTTLLPCYTADRNYIPPMIIYKASEYFQSSMHSQIMLVIKYLPATSKASQQANTTDNSSTVVEECIKMDDEYTISVSEHNTAEP